MVARPHPLIRHTLSELHYWVAMCFKSNLVLCFLSLIASPLYCVQVVRWRRWSSHHTWLPNKFWECSTLLAQPWLICTHSNLPLCTGISRWEGRGGREELHGVESSAVAHSDLSLCTEISRWGSRGKKERSSHTMDLKLWCESYFSSLPKLFLAKFYLKSKLGEAKKFTYNDT